MNRINIDRAKSETKLQQLEKELAQHDWGSDFSLYGGKCGYLLFLRELSALRNDSAAYEAQISALLDSAFADVQANDVNFSLCSGLSGLLFTCHYLDVGEAVEEDIRELLCSKAVEYAGGDYLDFLYGATGIVYALQAGAYAGKPAFNAWAEKTRSRLRKIDGVHRLPVLYKGHQHSIDNYQYNFSISHGQAAVMILLTDLLQQELIDSSYASLADNLFSGLLALRQKETNKNYSLYPSIIRSDNARFYFRQPSWCYGDFCFAIALNRYYRYTGNSYYKTLFIEILDYYLDITSPAEGGIRDADLCHGAAGIALIYKFFYEETAEDRYREAAERWFAHMLQMDHFADGVAGYKHYTEESCDKNYSLLEGATGIGLTLISFLSGKKLRWQDCFLIK